MERQAHGGGWQGAGRAQQACSLEIAVFQQWPGAVCDSPLAALVSPGHVNVPPYDQSPSLTDACLLLSKPVALGPWQELRVLEGRNDFWRLTVRGGGGHDLLTISPVLQSRAFKRGGSSRSCDATAGVAVAPIGLVNMMNAGGAVLAAEFVGEDLWKGTCWMPPGPPGLSRDRRAGWQRQYPGRGLPSLPRIQGECAFLWCAC